MRLETQGTGAPYKCKLVVWYGAGYGLLPNVLEIQTLDELEEQREGDVVFGFEHHFHR